MADTLAWWRTHGGQAGKLTCRTFAQFVECVVSADGLAAAWILDDGTDAKLLHDVLGVLTDAHVPVLLSRFDAADGPATAPPHGVAMTPAGASAAVLTAMLDATWAQASTVRALK